VLLKKPLKQGKAAEKHLNSQDEEDVSKDGEGGGKEGKPEILGFSKGVPGVRVKENRGCPTALTNLGVGGALLLQQHQLLFLLALGIQALLLLFYEDLCQFPDFCCLQDFTVSIWAKRKRTDKKNP
jgi:hypothetical protein